MARRSGILSLVVGVVAATLAVHAAPELLPVTIETSVTGVQSGAERIVSLFAVATGEVLDLEPRPPSVAIRNTPNLAYFDHRSGTIVLAHWPTLGPDLRGFFLGLADTAEEAGALFVGLFDQFLVAHEMGHWAQRGLGVKRDRYGAEREANDLAVAFFRTVTDGELLLLDLRSRVAEALSRLADPTPADEDEREFFNTQYAQLARNPAAYGYYQFRFILDSIDARESLDFKSLLRGMTEP